jgi:hypothetical protein
MYKAAVLDTEIDLLQLLFHSYLLVCTFAPVAVRPQCSYVKINLEYVKRTM